MEEVFIYLFFKTEKLITQFNLYCKIHLGMEGVGERTPEAPDVI